MVVTLTLFEGEDYNVTVVLGVFLLLKAYCINYISYTADLCEGGRVYSHAGGIWMPARDLVVTSFAVRAAQPSLCFYD